MMFTTTGHFLIILVVCVYFAWVIGHQWALEEFKKEGGNIDEKNRGNAKQ